MQIVVQKRKLNLASVVSLTQLGQSKRAAIFRRHFQIHIVTLRGCHQFLSSNDVLSVVGLVVCFVVRTARAMVRTPKPALRELQVSV